MRHKKIQEAINKAKEVLEENSILSPPIPIEEIVELYELELRFVDFGDKSKQISGLYDSKSRVIYVNKTESPQRQRFTIAHELAHALMHGDELKDNPNLGIFYRKPLRDKIFESIEEQQANNFAANALVPETLLKKLYTSCKSHEILAKVFNVSRQVIDFHIQNLGLEK